jgi:DNA topoisomerase IB
MSRFLVISRSNPDEAEVKDTAVKIYQSYLENDTAHEERFKLLGSHYFKFINKWNANLNNRDGFFGLRDFYSYVKYVCSQIKANGNDPGEIDKAIARAIQINFDGQRESLKIFR